MRTSVLPPEHDAGKGPTWADVLAWHEWLERTVGGQVRLVVVPGRYIAHLGKHGPWTAQAQWYTDGKGVEWTLCATSTWGPRGEWSTAPAALFHALGKLHDLVHARARQAEQGRLL